MRETTEVRVDVETGLESHESWLLIGAHKVSSSPPGVRLFDSEVTHQHFIQVEISRCDRRRDLNRDWLHQTELLMRVEMSEAQWGAFVSSFGVGRGVPATLAHLDGPVPGAPFDSRLDHSAQEVRSAGASALAKVQDAQRAVDEAFERKAGRREMGPLLRTLKFAVENAPSNMGYAAETLTEHVENVVQKARADIEAMALAAADSGDRTLGGGAAERLLEGGG